MPLQLLFRTHPDLATAALHGHQLYERQLVPIDVVYQYMRARGSDYFTEYVGVDASDEVRARWNRRLGGPQPLIHWMLQVVSLIEKALRAELFWTFERHYFSRWCDEDSENAFEIGPVRWLVTIKDQRGNIVHPGWAIAFSEDWGDLMIVRAKPGSASSFDRLEHHWTKCRTRVLPKLLSTMRKYVERSSYSYY